MDFKYFSYNGQVLPIDQAVIPLTSKEYTYGFGVYETIRIKNGIPYFLKEHAKRLIESARIIELEHPFSLSFVENSVLDLIKKIGPMTINLKVLLLGAPIKEKASLYLVCLNPLFPDKKVCPVESVSLIWSASLFNVMLVCVCGNTRYSPAEIDNPCNANVCGVPYVSAILHSSN